MFTSDFVHGLAIFGLTFVLEDIAVLGAALLVVNSMIPLPWAAGSSFAGIWVGDMGLYFLASRFGRPMLENRWFRRFTGNVDLRRSEGWFRNHGTAAILLSRAIPGTRLPTYLLAGLLKVPAGNFASFTAGACLVWVGLLFLLSYRIGMAALGVFEMFRSEAAKLGVCVIIAVTTAWLLRKLSHRVSQRSKGRNWRRLLQWEFWPPALFYVPVALKYAQLAMRYRSLALPTLANPGIETGGLIGESKHATLADLSLKHPEFTAETWLVRFESVAQQIAAIDRVRMEQSLAYPFVLKPDVGQRGFGFRVVHSETELAAYVERFRRDTLLQRYVPGPLEAGIFYYRFPREAKGRILAITDKAFPEIVGDGRRTMEELICADERASAMSATYLARFSDLRKSIPAAGESFRLVEAGNHCQGAIFRDGKHLWTRELEERIDEISRAVPGFFVGRYDVRYGDENALREGREFQIIELNGASSEPTSVYDSRNSLRDAYRMLFRQWEIVFEIGDQNRRLGLRPTSMRTVLKEWQRYRAQVALHPVSD